MIAGIIWAIILSFRGFGEAIAILGFIGIVTLVILIGCLLYTSPSPRDRG